MEKTELIKKLLNLLNEIDPPHALLLLGISKTADWVVKLSEQERKIIYQYFNETLSLTGDLPIKEQIIMVLQRVGGKDSLDLLNQIIIQGIEFHGEFLYKQAKTAISKLQINKS